MFSGGYKLGNDNNLDEAELQDVTTTATTVDSPTVNRKAASKINAYAVPFVQSFAHDFHGKLSKYLNKDKSRAFNINVSSKFGFDKWKNILSPRGDINLSAGIGYFISLLDPKDKRSAVTFEIFLNFTDILNSGDATTKFYERHQLGLRFGVPFKSIFIND